MTNRWEAFFQAAHDLAGVVNYVSNHCSPEQPGDELARANAVPLRRAVDALAKRLDALLAEPKPAKNGQVVHQATANLAMRMTPPASLSATAFDAPPESGPCAAQH